MRSADAAGDAAELARRFFLGHGPASIQDLARWASLTVSQCWEALETIRDSLDCVTVEGVELWFDPDALQVGQSRDALLLPLYDELILSYPLINFPQANGHPHAPGEDLFVGSVIIAETNVGTWRRTLQRSEDDHGDCPDSRCRGAVTRTGRGSSEQAGDLCWNGVGADDHRLMN